MAKKIKLKTKKNTASVSDYIQSADSEKVRQAGEKLLDVFTSTTGAEAKMWGPSIVGFGEYAYQRSNGDEGTFLATGFSLRKSGPVVYIMPGYTDFTEELQQLGPHKLGKSCLYLKNLDGIDLSVLKKIIKKGLKELAKTHQVTMQ